MAWFKVDDRLHASRKPKSIPRKLRLEAMGLWVIAGSWAAGEGLDGFIPDYMIEEFGGRQDIVDELVKSGLWETSEGGTSFYSWTEYNPDAETVKAGQDAKSEGAKQGNHKRWHVKRQTKVPGCEWCFPNIGSASVIDQIPDQFTDTYANPPDPTRPDPTPTSKEVGGASRGSRVTDPFPISDEMRTWGKDETPLVDLDKKTLEFVDYWAALPGQKGIKSDWLRTWKNGMRKQQEFAERDQAKKPNKPVGKIASNDEWMYR